DAAVARIDVEQRGPPANRGAHDDAAVGHPLERTGLVLPVAQDVARLAAVHVDDVDAALAGPHAQVGNEGELLAVRRPGEVALAAHEPGDAPRLAAVDRDDEDVVVVARRLVAHGIVGQLRDRIAFGLDDGVRPELRVRDERDPLAVRRDDGAAATAAEAEAAAATVRVGRVGDHPARGVADGLHPDLCRPPLAGLARVGREAGAVALVGQGHDVAAVEAAGVERLRDRAVRRPRHGLHARGGIARAVGRRGVGGLSGTLLRRRGVDDDALVARERAAPVPLGLRRLARGPVHADRPGRAFAALAPRCEEQVLTVRRPARVRALLAGRGVALGLAAIRGHDPDLGMPAVLFFL